MQVPPAYPYADVVFEYAPGPFAALADSDLGRALWAFLTRLENVHAMVVAVRVGAAPVSAISADLLGCFGSGDPAQTPREALASGLAARFPFGANVSLEMVKRMMGHMIRQILTRLGLVLRTRNSSANDRTGIFTTAARYDFGPELNASGEKGGN